MSANGSDPSKTYAQMRRRFVLAGTTGLVLSVGTLGLSAAAAVIKGTDKFPLLSGINIAAAIGVVVFAWQLHWIRSLDGSELDDE